MFSLENPAGGRNDITFEEYRREKMRLRFEKGDMNNVLENMSSKPRPPPGKVELVRTVVKAQPKVRTLNYQMSNPTGAESEDFDEDDDFPPPPLAPRDGRDGTAAAQSNMSTASSVSSLGRRPSAGDYDYEYYDLPRSPPASQVSTTTNASGIYEEFDENFVNSLSGGVEEISIANDTDSHLYAVVNKNRRASGASTASSLYTPVSAGPNDSDTGGRGAAFHRATPIGAFPHRDSPGVSSHRSAELDARRPSFPDEVLYESVDFGRRQSASTPSPGIAGDKKYEFNGKKFHDECFTCALCKNPIGNNSFVPREQDELVCMPCYEGNLAQKCGKCTKILTKGGVTFRDSAFHKECFLCTECGVELANTKFATKDDMPYCPDCYVKSFAKLCEKCTKPIAGLGEATKYVAFEGRQWHADCFECGKCSKSLLGQGFLVQKNEVLCPECGNQ